MKFKIPLDIHEFDEGYHIHLEAKINDKPVKLVLDTGASKTVFDITQIKDIIEEAEYKEINSLSVGIGTDTLTSYSIKINLFSIGKLEIENFETVLIDMNIINDSYAKFNLPGIQGILGSDVLINYNANIDLKKKVISFESPIK
ncbi:MAG: retropepsin-like aspartic protease [Bacteroidota bacterium]|nr:retropepsin-like aspartic protease [Bacteroidota bacterium]